MWIYRFTYCLIQGHAFMDLASSRGPYRYCLHCGKIVEAGRPISGRHLQTQAVRTR